MKIFSYTFQIINVPDYDTLTLRTFYKEMDSLNG